MEEKVVKGSEEADTFEGNANGSGAEEVLGIGAEENAANGSTGFKDWVGVVKAANGSALAFNAPGVLPFAPDALELLLVNAAKGSSDDMIARTRFLVC